MIQSSRIPIHYCLSIWLVYDIYFLWDKELALSVIMPIVGPLCGGRMAHYLGETVQKMLIPPLGSESCNNSLIVVETIVSLRDRPATISSGSLLLSLSNNLFRPL